MTIKIVTDSTCDLPTHIISGLGITVVPCYLNFGEDSYKDGIDITKHQFYTRLRRYHIHPTTSAPNPQTFLNVYQNLIANGASEIISIHLPKAFSSMINAAEQAARSIKSVKISVFDSGQLSLGMGFMAAAAAKAAAIGKTSDEVLKMLVTMVKNTYIFAVLDTLEFLRRSGRLSSFKSKLGTLLDIKPFIVLHNGEIKLDIIRANIKAMNRLLNKIKDLGQLEQLAVLHLDAPEKAEALYQQTCKLVHKGKEKFIEEATPALGVHLGPGAVATVCVCTTQ